MASKTFFPRGNGPLVSILLPTRGRPESLEKAMLSAYQNAANPKNIEFLLKVDTDDQDTIEKVNQIMDLGWPCRIHMDVYDRCEGYASLHQFVNRLCYQAKGDWLFLYNDDSLIKTPNWDLVIENLCTFNRPLGIQDVCLLQLEQQGDPASYSFSALRHSTWKLLGERYSLFLHCDLWLFQLMNAVDMIVKCPVTVAHLQEHEADETGKASIASAVNEWRWMKAPSAVYERLSLAGRLIDYRYTLDKTAHWVWKPTSTGWWWYLGKNEPEVPMFVCTEAGKIGLMGKQFDVLPNCCVGPKYGSDKEPWLYQVDQLDGIWHEIKGK